MKRKTYNNVLKAARLIRKKGYEEKESLEMAVQVFDNMEMLQNGMSAEVTNSLKTLLKRNIVRISYASQKSEFRTLKQKGLSRNENRSKRNSF